MNNTRFGVNQRISIVEKGKDINLLVMTATPIQDH